MTKTIQLPSLPDEVEYIYFPKGTPPLDLLIQVWQTALSMAMWHDASSVHYHPWRTDHLFSMVVDKERWGVHPSA